MNKLWNGEESKGLRYVVKKACQAEQLEVESFDNLDEAIKYSENEVKGFILWNGDYNAHGDTFWYEIYDTSIPNWDENLDESSVYTTKEYWK